MTAAGAAERLGVHAQTIARMESAQTVPRRATVEHLMRLYDAEEELPTILAELEHAAEPGWWHPYRDLIPPHMDGLMDLEAESILTRMYAPQLVPELLRTTGYARALLAMRYPRSSAADVDQHLALLQERQKHRRGKLWVLLEEVAIHRPIGDVDVMAEQRAYLEQCINEPGQNGITIQWISFFAPPHPLMLCGPVEIYRHPNDRIPDHLVLRGLHEQTVTDHTSNVRTHMAAMDLAAAEAHTPTTPLPTIDGSTQ